ncbi:unnamed protein product [Merluccius merluccius]
MVVAHSYKPNWPDEVALVRGDVILVLSKHEEERWFGRLRSGERGYFPASCVTELGQGNVVADKDPSKALSLRSSIWAHILSLRGRCGSAHGLQRAGRGEGGERGGAGAGRTGAPRERVGPFLVLRPQITLAPQPTESHRSPGLLHRMLSKRWKKTEYQGATNGAFEAD